MADRLILQDIEVECRIGTTEQERASAQPLRIDVAIAIDAAQIAAQDQVQGALDYARVVERVRAICASKEFNLLETLADRLADALLWEARAKSVQVCVKKRALAGIGYAAVEVERRK
jgi:dihydroneopterin aldolase